MLKPVGYVVFVFVFRWYIFAWEWIAPPSFGLIHLIPCYLYIPSYFILSHHWIVWYYKCAAHRCQFFQSTRAILNHLAQTIQNHKNHVNMHRHKTGKKNPKNSNWNRMMPEHTGTPFHTFQWPILIWFKWLKVLGQWPKPSARHRWTRKCWRWWSVVMGQWYHIYSRCP